MKLRIITGAKVVLASRQKDKLDRIVEDLKLAGISPKNLMSLKCDITNREDVHTVVSNCVDRFAKIDILVNCAGLMYYCLASNGYTDEWRRMIDVNCHGTTNVIGEVVPQMIKQSSGHIVNVSQF
jgi:NADP-dependent 3-hydroxy acid dehydrogenase YdfG